MTTRSLAAAIVAAATSCAAWATAPAPGCAEAKRAVAALTACVETGSGVVLAATTARAEAVAAHARAGEARFNAYFGQPSGPYAVFDHDTGAEASERGIALKAAGFKEALPLASATLQRTTFKEAVRGLERRRAEMTGLSGEEARAAVEAAVDRHAKRSVLRRDEGFVPRELGRCWFVQLFWKAAPPASEATFGSPAPDWLDEVAAVLMEDESSADRKRQAFHAAYDGAAPTREGVVAPRPAPLTAFLADEHPMARALASQRGGPVVVMRFTGSEASAAQVISLFSPQARVFADYLIARSGDARVFAAIARAHRSGTAFETWLKDHGATHRLPSTLTGLARDWEEWLASR